MPVLYLCIKPLTVYSIAGRQGARPVEARTYNKRACERRSAYSSDRVRLHFSMDFIVRPLLRRPFVLSRLVRCLCGPCETNDVASTASLGDSQQKITALLPSQTFLAGLSLSEKNHVEKIIEELEIYLWMSPRPPLYLDDELWYRLMKQEDLRARLTCLKMFSVAQHKDLRALERKKLEQEEFSKHVEKEQEKFMRGEMAYGSGFYQLVSSPLRNRKSVSKSRERVFGGHYAYVKNLVLCSICSTWLPQHHSESEVVLACSCSILYQRISTGTNRFL
ncbi:hypothetical protein AB6A40_001300 [Gnathostoma spinigerum]|uniref:Uncharacterized protein n=1 Tax=Gnathostoma spinigerum TaxID=75299 RepID=A0ABD6EAZ8_9BILA